jgi:DNA-binding transcriptional LysR family regulator
MNLRGLDLNLLTVFEVVYEEGNQVRSADRLGMTQPAVSSAMSRLRQVVKDDLFLPGPRGVTPTPAADRLYTQVNSALELIREGIRGEQKFDPMTVERTFRVATGYASAALGSIGDLLAWLRREAPGVRLAIEASEKPGELPRRLRIGAIDFVADYVRYDEDDLVHEVILEQRLVAIVRKGHPRIRGRLTMKRFNEEKHVVHQEKHSPGQAPRLADAFAGLSYEADVEVGNALAIPIIVGEPDLVAVTTEKTARFFETRFDLQVLDLPFKAPMIPILLIWHRSRTRDAGHRWLREGMRKLISASER